MMPAAGNFEKVTKKGEQMGPAPVGARGGTRGRRWSGGEIAHEGERPRKEKGKWPGLESKEGGRPTDRPTDRPTTDRHRAKEARREPEGRQRRRRQYALLRVLLDAEY